MGMFDYVDCDDERVVCPNGHQLKSLQTKDLDNVCGTIVIAGGAFAGQYKGPLGRTPTDADKPLTSTIDIYEDCDECPVLLTRNKMRDGCKFTTIHTMWCEFTLTIVDNVVTDVKRISETFDEWIASAPTKPYLVDYEGPMTFAEAQAIMHARNEP